MSRPQSVDPGTGLWIYYWVEKKRVQLGGLDVVTTLHSMENERLPNGMVYGYHSLQGHYYAGRERASQLQGEDTLDLVARAKFSKVMESPSEYKKWKQTRRKQRQRKPETQGNWMDLLSAHRDWIDKLTDAQRSELSRQTAQQINADRTQAYQQHVSYQEHLKTENEQGREQARQWLKENRKK